MHITGVKSSTTQLTATSSSLTSPSGTAGQTESPVLAQPGDPLSGTPIVPA